jgi:hypothetical protein
MFAETAFDGEVLPNIDACVIFPVPLCLPTVIVIIVPAFVASYAP